MKYNKKADVWFVQGRADLLEDLVYAGFVLEN